MFLKFLEQHRINTLELAAAFFSSYETMKKILPLSDRLAPVNHMISASVAEVVRMFPYIFRSAIPFSRLLSGDTHPSRLPV